MLNKALTRVLFNLIANEGLRSESSLHGAKQADMTAQKLMIADGRESEPGLVLLKSFPPPHLLVAAPMLPLQLVGPQPQFATSFGRQTAA